jgi:diaminohydroxyphosphoribosylaminopyrimidine deaminase / 5-amino-6-(5-phosphoribosylamino)uracil reductase
LTELSEVDRRWLDSAVRLARPYLGTTGVAPTASAIIVDLEQTVVGRGVTGPGGEPTAIATALAEAGEFAAGATLYVTIEPSWPDCAAAVEAHVVRFVIGLPDPARQGEGVDALRDARIEAEIAAHAASRDLHEAYATRVGRGRPFTTLFLAVSRDGMVGHKDGLPTSILSEKARRWLALQRLCADAVVTGLNPQDNLRLNGIAERQPLNVVLVGTRQPVDPASGRRLMFALPRRAHTLPEDSPEIVEVDGRSGRPDLRLVLKELGSRGINALHVEAGPRLTESFIAAELVDRFHLIRGPAEIGRGGVPATALGAIEARIKAAGFTPVAARDIGPDSLMSFERTL